MKINSLYIHAFGGLKNLSLDFGDGFTVIYGDNEKGKSTIMAFIKMMFYGSGRAGGTLAKNIRQKYTPWDTAQMAGSIDFEHGGKKYRLEKEFKTSNSTDKATLCDLDFGTRQAVSGDVGLNFFGLSLAAFERTVFIGQLGFPEKDAAAEGEINSKLSNIALTGEESVSFEAVNARLSKAKLNLMSKSGKAGIYDKNLKLLKETEEQIEKSRLIMQQIANKKAQVNAIQTEIENLGKRALELKAKIDSEQDIRNAEKMRKLLSLKAELDSLNGKLKLADGSFIDEMYIGKIKFCLSKVNGVLEKIKEKQNEIDVLEKSISAGLNKPEDVTEEDLEKIKAEILKLQNENNGLEAQLESKENELKVLESKIPELKNAKKKFSLPLLLIGIFMILAAVGVLSFVPSLLPAIVLGIIGATNLILSFVLRPADKQPLERLLERISALKTEIADLRLKSSTALSKLSVKQADCKALDTALNTSTAVIENQRLMLNNYRTELNNLLAEKQTAEKPLFEQFGKYRAAQTSEEVVAELDKLADIANNQKQLKQQINYILNDLNGISYEQAEQKLKELGESHISSEDFETLKTEYEGLREAVTDKKSQIATLNAEISAISQKYEDTEVLKRKFDTLKEKTDSQREFCLKLDLAAEVLADSFGEVRRSFGSVLEKRASEILNRLTTRKWNGMNISKSLDIAVSEEGNFGSREADYLSNGAADQAYLSLRLALSELMCSDTERLSVLLDDALTQYDDRRTAAALGFLKEYSADTQVVMFTCHRFICDLAKETGANIINLGE